MQFKGVNRSPIRSHLNGFQFIAELGFRNSEYATSRKADIIQSQQAQREKEPKLNIIII